VTLSLALRAPQRRRAQARPIRAGHLPARPRATARRSASWEVRSFVAVSAAIGAGFVLVLFYLSLATAVSAEGYESQRLATQRAELRRQNSLLEVESARLASPARIEAEAARLGLRPAAQIKVVPAEALAAAR
jgi:hypothetical protein